MKLTDLNRHGGIGANAHLVQIGAFNLLVDCGLHPKKLGKDAMPDFEPIGSVDIEIGRASCRERV